LCSAFTAERVSGILLYCSVLRVGDNNGGFPSIGNYNEDQTHSATVKHQEGMENTAFPSPVDVECVEASQSRCACGWRSRNYSSSAHRRHRNTIKMKVELPSGTLLYKRMCRSMWLIGRTKTFTYLPSRALELNK
jgi:hypothetical protein